MEIEIGKEVTPPTLIPIKSFGQVKSVGTRKVQGTGIRNGTPETKDGYGDYFSSLTKTGLRNGSDRPFIMEHWEEAIFAFHITGEAIYEKKDEGWEYEATLTDDEVGNLAYEYLSDAAKSYHSSTGSAWNYTKGIFTSNDAFLLTVWLVLEQTATLRPADFWNPQIKVKNMADFKHLSAIIAPLLDERTQHILGIERLEESFKELKSQVDAMTIKTVGDSSIVQAGIALPEDVSQTVAELLEFASSIK